MIRALTLAITLSTLVACAAPTSDAGTEYRFRVNELIATLPYSLERVAAAADLVVREDMRWSVEDSSVGNASARIRARGAADRTRVVAMVARADGSTEVRIVVNDGPFGNAERSREVMDRLEERLAGE